MEPHLSIQMWRGVEGEAARILLDRDAARFLGPFMARSLSLSEAARELGVRRDTLLYRVRRMLDAGLLVTQERQFRSGRTRKLYRTSADGFLVRFPSSEAGSVLGLFLRREQPFREALGAGLLSALGAEAGWHLRVYRDPVLGTLRNEAAPDQDPAWAMGQMLAPSAPATWYTNITVCLPADQAKAFQRELAELAQRFHRSRQSGGTVHTLQLGLAPTMIRTGR